MKIIDGRPFECTKCGECCRWPGIVKLTDEDIGRISAYIRMPVDEYVRVCTEISRRSGDRILKDTEGTKDCVHLKDNLCEIHQVKPEQCRTNPQKYDPRCPGFGDKRGKEAKRGGIMTSYEQAVKEINERCSGTQAYLKAVSDNLYHDLNKKIKSASVASQALVEGVDAYLGGTSLKVASLADLFAFDRVDKKHLIHKSTKDLWEIEADQKGQVRITRLFDNNGEPIRG